METPSRPKIVTADKLNGDLILTFDDDTCALFTAAFMYANLAHARIVEEMDEEE